MKKELNKEKTLTIIFIALGILLALILSIKFYNDFLKTPETNEKKNIDSIELYGYVLHDEDTKLYKDEFKALSNILSEKEVNYEDYAKTLTKMFIIDFYTLTNKISSTDIGGLDLIHKDQLESFKLNAGDTIYKYVESNVYGDRKQELPEVSEVNITSTSESKFTYNSKEYDSYEIEASWNYIKDFGYPKKGKFILLKDGIKLYMVKGE